MKIFNKQRLIHTGGKNLKKYLKYALGEIILVVLGILIAVAVNNWNQRKQLNDANVELKHNIIEQLDKDINAIVQYEKDLDELQKKYLNYLNVSTDSTHTLSGDILGSLLFEVNTMDIDTHAINLIDNASLNESKATKKLLDLNSTYKMYLEEIKSVERLIFSTITDNLKEIERTQDWYTEFVTNLRCQDDCVNYLTNDKRHKARIASLRFLYINGYGNIVKSLKRDLIQYKNDLRNIED